MDFERRTATFSNGRRFAPERHHVGRVLETAGRVRVFLSESAKGSLFLLALLIVPVVAAAKAGLGDRQDDYTSRYWR